MDKKQTPALDRLKEQVRLQKTAEFPDVTSPDAEVRSVVERLRMYDQTVSMHVIETIQGKPVSLEFLDDGHAIRNELQRLHSVKPEAMQKVIDRLLMYHERLVVMISLVREVMAERGKA